MRLLLIGLALLLSSSCSNAPGRAQWSALGSGPLENFGAKVAPAGDVNGDGFDDLAVWASGHDGHRGRIEIFAGSAQGLSQSPAWTGQGENPADQYGHSFGAAGDVNGDGFKDFIAAAQNFGSPEKKDSGKIYLYAGKAQGLASQAHWTRRGERSGELLGDCSAWIGDANRDGLDDLVVGAYGAFSFRGRAMVLLGSRENGLAGRPAWQAEGESEGDWFGYSVFRAGRLRAGVKSGVVIGAKYARVKGLGRAGKVYVYCGDGREISKRPCWTAEGEQDGSQFGWRAVTAGDLDGSGYESLAVGAPHHGRESQGPDDPGYALAGKAYVYSGSKLGLSTKPAWSASGDSLGSQFGHALASGDFNGDAYSDLLVSAPGHAKSRGQVKLYLGGKKGLGPTAARIWSGENEGDFFGQGLANAGDVNGDGVEDFSVGAPSHAGKGRRSGKVYLYYGSRRL